MVLTTDLVQVAVELPLLEVQEITQPTKLAQVALVQIVQSQEPLLQEQGAVADGLALMVVLLVERIQVEQMVITQNFLL